MTRRQSFPRQWLVADERLGEHLWGAIRKLPRGSGILFLHRRLPTGERARLLARLRGFARARGLMIADEAAAEAARVHDLKELRAALLSGVPFILLSPMFETRSHPDWAALGRMKAAALIRMSPVRVLALGGMNARRFRRLQPLGFSGWAGIDVYGP